MSSSLKLGNPAVVGLGGFGLTTFVLQLHNLGLCSIAPVIVLGLIFGGAAQLFAGFQEMKVGNNFGFCAFSGYGAFWIALCLMLIFNRYGMFAMSTQDLGWFLVAFTLFTAILFVGSLKISKGLAFIFLTLLVGFILLDLECFVSPAFKKPAAIDLIICAAAALYGMAHGVFIDVFGKDVLPMGEPIL